MPTAFSQTLRALDRERFSLTLVGWLPAVVLLGGWGAWMSLAGVPVYEVSQLARLEVDRAVHPVAAPLAGRVVATHLAVGREVQAGDVLVELDANAQRLQQQEQRVRLTALAARLTALHQEVAAEEDAGHAEQQAAQAARTEAQARLREAEVTLRPSEEEADTDQGGLTDGEEVELGTDPHAPDSDGDGFRDGVEIAAESDPLEAQSVPTALVYGTNTMRHDLLVLNPDTGQATVLGSLNGDPHPATGVSSVIFTTWNIKLI
jgi:pyruvate/2-oxoglutarate dehydrogenase complex dihydrolipoamide acyltransferase (E2) component